MEKRIKSENKLELPNGLYTACWHEGRVKIWGYGKENHFVVNEVKAEPYMCTVELINGIAYINDK
jgi:hypothetical protein